MDIRTRINASYPLTVGEKIVAIGGGIVCLGLVIVFTGLMMWNPLGSLNQLLGDNVFDLIDAGVGLGFALVLGIQFLWMMVTPVSRQHFILCCLALLLWSSIARPIIVLRTHSELFSWTAYISETLVIIGVVIFFAWPFLRGQRGHSGQPSGAE